MDSTAPGPGEQAAERSARAPSGATRLDSLEALYEAHHRQAIGLAYHLLGDLGEAEEVAQEAFLGVWRAGSRYDPQKGSTRTWLLAMVRNRAIDRLRARRRRPVRQLDDSLDMPDGNDLVSQAAASIDAQAARLALASLAPEQRQVIELAYFGGLSHAEIAAHTATPVGTVKGRIRLALNHLRTALGVAPDALATP